MVISAVLTSRGQFTSYWRICSPSVHWDTFTVTLRLWLLSLFRILIGAVIFRSTAVSETAVIVSP